MKSKIESLNGLLNSVPVFDDLPRLGNSIIKCLVCDLVNEKDDVIKYVKEKKRFHIYRFTNRLDKHISDIVKLIERTKLYNVKLKEVYDTDSCSGREYRNYVYQFTKL
jgi:hypothetical protein